jgi:hypothetical protein
VKNLSDLDGFVQPNTLVISTNEELKCAVGGDWNNVIVGFGEAFPG